MKRESWIKKKLKLFEEQESKWNKNQPIRPDLVDYRTDQAMVHSNGGNEFFYAPHNSVKTTINSIYNRLANDVASTSIKHVVVDSNGVFIEEAKSPFNVRFNWSANIDQSGRDLLLEATTMLLSQGHVALVATATDDEDGYDPNVNNISSIRCGYVTKWHTQTVDVEVYNETTGNRETVYALPKQLVAIAYNPFGVVMNEQNSTLNRLLDKMNSLDKVESITKGGKLDIIVSLPYTVNNETRRAEAESRRASLEAQINNSEYGIGYIDSSEGITQLNRQSTNKLLEQIEMLQKDLLSELHITKEILDGTANEEVMLNYMNRTVEPIINSLVDAMRRVWIDYSDEVKDDIKYYKDRFELVPVEKLAEVADKFSRNEILSANEFRGIIGFKPSADPRSDQLLNKNMAANPENDSKTSKDDPIKMEENLVDLEELLKGGQDEYE